MKLSTGNAEKLAKYLKQDSKWEALYSFGPLSYHLSRASVESERAWDAMMAHRDDKEAAQLSMAKAEYHLKKANELMTKETKK